MRPALLFVALLLVSCAQFTNADEPPPPVNDSMSGEHLLMSQRFYSCMNDAGASIADVSVEIWDEYNTVTDVAWVLIEGPEPPDSVIDDCTADVNAAMAERAED